MRKSDPSIRPVFITGFSAVIIQCVLIREFLAIFFGNELVLGIIFSVWLFFCGIGSLWGNKRGRWHSEIYTAVLTASAVVGILFIRYFPILFEPGAVIPTAAIAFLFIVAEAPVSFLTGYIFGTLSKVSSKRHHIYGIENFGALLGAAVLYGIILLGATNAVLLIAAIIPLSLINLLDKQDFSKRNLFITTLTFTLILLLSIILYKTDKKSASWKYAGEVAEIQYTKEGEIAYMIYETDTTILLNNKMYKSTLNEPIAEQAVHIPAAQRKYAENVLVIFDRGHYTELTKYPELNIDIIETLPEVASKQSIITTPEKYNPDKRYDLVFIGAPLPENTASSRFYTVSFFKRMNAIMSPEGVLTFTLPFNENYMPPNEQQLYNILRNTLNNVFPFVLVFPGDGFSTFMASNTSLIIPDSITIKTNYLSPFIIPALSEGRVEKANSPSQTTTVNKNTRPIALYFSLKSWMEVYGFSAALLICLLVVILVLAVFLLPKSRSVLSVATSGLATGVYSIAIMLLYQATYGSLYSEISLLLLALSLGFAAGSKLRRLPFSDSVIGIYFVLSFFILSIIPQPHVLLFIICHFGIGFLSAGQFVTRKDTLPGILNTADLIGGVFGMALSSTLLIPIFGIVPVAIVIFIIKVIIEILPQKV